MVLILSTLVACGSGDDAPPDGGITARDGGVVRDAGVVEEDAGTATFCEQRCDFETRCNPGDASDFCGALCEAWSLELRPAAIDALAMCLGVGDDCSVAQDEDSCYRMAAVAAGTRTIDDDLRTACTTKHTSCNDTFPLGLCDPNNNVELYVDSVIAEATSCFDAGADCSAVFDCFLAALPSID